MNDKGKITKTVVNARLKTLEPDEDEAALDDIRLLKGCLSLIGVESEALKAVKEAQAKLDQKLLDRYGTLKVAEIKLLVVEDKWLAGYPDGC